MTKAKPPEGGGAKLRDQTPLEVGRSAELPGGARRRRCVGGPERLENGLATIHCHTERETRVLESLRKRHEDEDEGFTLIELMVVVLIIAILLAIAIPTFLGARERAQDRAAQSDIRNALAAEKVYYTDEEEYTDGVTGVGAKALASIEPSLEYTTVKDTEDAVTVLVLAAETGTTDTNGGAVCLGKKSKSGNKFSLLDVAVGDFAGSYYYNDNTDCGGKSNGATTAVTDPEAATGFESKTGW